MAEAAPGDGEVRAATAIGRRRLLSGAALLAGAAALGACRRADPAPPGGNPASSNPDPPATGPSGTLPAAGGGAGGTSVDAPTGAGYVPPASGTWETVTPADTGWTPAGLDELEAYVMAHNSTSLVVVAGGRILREVYADGVTAETPREIASCQKSVVSTLVGQAVDRGLLGLDDPVSDHLAPGWTAATPEQERAITIRHLLSMTSGLDQDTLTVADPPGTRWRYNTTAYQKLRPVLEAVTGQGIDDLTRSWLWTPIGVSSASRWSERRGAGPLARDATGSQLWSLDMTARDMARFGLLVQRHGGWSADEVVPGAWLDQALAPSQDLNRGYGFLWWLGRGMGKGVPDDLVAALGALDQMIVVVPSLDVVLVRQGGAGLETSQNTSSFQAEVVNRLVQARA